MNALEEEWVTHTIMEDERRRCISKILQLECSDAVPKGNNYVSDIYRIRIKVINNSGEIEERSAVYKILPVTGNKLAGVRELGFFSVEARMYTETLPEILKLIQSKEDGAIQFWPEFYGVKGNYEGYLMEDLVVSGYAMGNKRLGFDFEHCVFALKQLAKFHAIAAVLRERRVLRENDYVPNNYHVYNPKSAEETQRRVLESLAKSIESNWPSQWHGYIHGLSNVHDKLYKIIREALENKQDMFLTLNHGDFWLNNLMFRYSAGVPTKIMFLDFQFCYIHSPCYDIQYFFTTSLGLKFFGRKLELLRVYHDSLEENLKLYGYEGRVPSFEELERDFRKTRFYGYSIAMIVRTSKLSPPLHELMEKYNVTDYSEKYNLMFRSTEEDFLWFFRHILAEMREDGLI